ncbi:dynein axonemal intermediate chain 4-like isoform X1 [Mytilus trossulus]|uniref:dynein axonemal intermediate chain 4-like isoform X1 n=1 Tax=Mytilus trossulus TaxID=6551 RepID=UPI003007D56C
MSTSKPKKSNFLSTGNSQAGSRKGNVGASVIKSKYGGSTVYASTKSRSNLIGSASRKGLGGAGDKTTSSKPPVTVLDEAGNDVTPVPLIQTDPAFLGKKQSNVLADSSAGTPTDLMSQASIYQTANATASTFGGGPFSRSVFSASQGTANESIMGEEMADHSQDVSQSWDIKVKREDVKEVLLEDDLEKIVDLTLTETATIWLLDMPTVCVSNEADEAKSIQEKNEKYLQLQKNKVGNDQYMERGMNTFNEPPKVKVVQTTKITHSEIGVNATTWDMYDTFEALEKEKKEKEEKEEGEGTISRPASPVAKEETTPAVEGEAVPAPVAREGSSRLRLGAESRATIASSMAGSESVFASKETGVSSIPSELSAVEEDRIMKSENLLRDLFIMERVVNLNTYQSRQALYRGYPVLTELEKEMSANQQLSVSDMGPNFDRLWSYQCPLTKGRNVSSMSWNKLNPDLIAIGYGQFEFSDQKSGLVCCWSLKNPEYPERIYTCKEGVTTVDFSKMHPSLLAVGMYDGGVAIYNVKSTEDEAMIDSLQSPGKHTAPVWQIQWIDKERGSGEEVSEKLISISTDGRVTQWSIRKGFESYDMMRLKRMPTKYGSKKEKKVEAFISRHAGGMSFDFQQRDTNIYLAGTEEGHIHKCSCSYNEQYLDSFVGHTGPVYRVKWSPDDPDVFLSCSADWSVRLWHQERFSPVLTFLSSTKPVYDVAWSPKSATVFACVTENSVEVWDLNMSTLDPLIKSNPTSGAKQTTVSFSRNSDCILVGDSEGQVTVYQMRSMPANADLEMLRTVVETNMNSGLGQEVPDFMKTEEELDDVGEM